MSRFSNVFLAAPLLLSGCMTSANGQEGAGLTGIGETQYVDGPRVTPLAVLEDSRCPKGVTCVWAGRVRISARIDLGSGSEARELTLGEPQQVADGSLELVEVVPSPVKDRTIDAKDYGFRFRFMGGL